MRNRKYEVVCIAAFEHVTPAAELHVPGDRVIPVPEVVTRYTTGQRVDLGSASRRREFIKHHAGRFVIVE